jgi:hypothetical protein
MCQHCCTCITSKPPSSEAGFKPPLKVGFLRVTKCPNGVIDTSKVCLTLPQVSQVGRPVHLPFRFFPSHFVALPTPRHTPHRKSPNQNRRIQDRNRLPNSHKKILRGLLQTPCSSSFPREKEEGLFAEGAEVGGEERII